MNMPLVSMNRRRRVGGNPTPIVYLPFIPSGSTGLITADSLVFKSRLDVTAEGWGIVETLVLVAPTPASPTTPYISGGVLNGPAGIYRVVNATTVTDTEYSLTPPVSLSSLGTPGDDLTIYHLQFSSFSPDVELPAAAGISLVGSKTASWSGTTSNQTVSLTDLAGGIGSAPEADDIVILAYAVGSSSGTPALSVVTAGYTSIASLLSDDTIDTTLIVQRKIMGGTPDTSVQVSGTGSGNNAGIVEIFVFRGVNGTTPLDVAAVTATGINTGRPTPPAITPTTSGAWIYSMGASGNQAAASFTSTLSNFKTAIQGDTNSITVGAGALEWVSGTYTPAQFGGNSASISYSWAAVTLALRPA
jgi:hypothetical protein